MPEAVGLIQNKISFLIKKKDSLGSASGMCPFTFTLTWLVAVKWKHSILTEQVTLMGTPLITDLNEVDAICYSLWFSK